VPSRQLTSKAPQSAASYAVVTARVAWVYTSTATVGTTSARVMQVSYDTRLPVTATAPGVVEVAMLDGRHRALRARDVTVRRTGSAVHGTRASVIAAARSMLGTGYLWAGTAGFGFDCSGLTAAVFDVAGIRLSRDADQQARHGTAVARSALRPGDLVFYANSAGAIVHVALYVGTVDGTRSILEAPRTGVAVRIAPLRTSGYAGARRYPLG
jgi:cell wall-associated NlpC family hydrolase